ncbi:MAG: acetyl-CoA carboxylase biotin carboxyl carrier protein [Treponema sp.]|nr:acetyl-CoA carboxylase biotin carboxyl carrier protein [Treponema sp.]
MDDKFFLAMVDKFNSAAISELEFSDGSTRFVLRKDGGGSVVKSTAASGASGAASGSSAQAEQNVHLGISSGEGEKINSPIVATFYSSPSPDAPSFVKVGSKVKAGQTLCILEAMKMMNHLEAEFDCEIVAVHAKSTDLVEYGQALFTVKRN